jgi:nucleotide-binding universal stress UspA family protein
MSKPILAAAEPREQDRAAVRFGALVARLAAARLEVVMVDVRHSPVLAISANYQEQPYGVAGGGRDLADCTDAIEDVEAELVAAGVKVECLRFEAASAAGALQTAAEREDAGLLVVGSARRSRGGRVLTGSTAERLLAGAPCPVAIVPLGWSESGPPRTIGVAYVDTNEGRAAVFAAMAIARWSGARLLVVTVIENPAERAEAEKHLQWVPARFAKGVETTARVLTGDPAEDLIAVSAELDMLVCGSRGYGPLRAVLLGSVSHRLVQEAQCPVIVVPRGIEKPLEDIVGDAQRVGAHP